MAKPVWSFLGLAFGISWTIWIVAHWLGGGPGSGEDVLAFGSAGPALAATLISRSKQPAQTSRAMPRTICLLVVWLLGWAVYLANDSFREMQPSPGAYRYVVGLLALIPAWVVSGAFARDAGTRQLLRTLVRPPNFRWVAIGLFFFPAMLLIPAAIVKAFGGTLVWPQHRGSVWAYALQGTMLFLSSLLFTAVLEEPGWRGFLLPRLQQRLSPLVASLFVWLPWALWHAPLDISGGVASSLMRYIQVRVVFLIAIVIILTWLYNRSGGNLLAVALFHAGMNTFPFVLPYAPMMLGLIFVVAIYVIIAERMWRRRVRASAESTQIPLIVETSV